MTPGGKIMPRHMLTDDQLLLFSKQVQWREFPQDVRQRVSRLLAALCMDIIEDHPHTKEDDHEPRDDSFLAS
jgi:hypothetical protein